jgi:rod shape-determining protein MreD
MLTREPRFPGAVMVSLLIAVILTIIPLNEQMSLWRPEWIALTLVHWALVIRDKISLVMAFVIGLIIDVLFDPMIGQHTVGYVLVTYLAVRLGLRMNPEAFLQQTALLIAVLVLYLITGLLIQGATNTHAGGWLYWATLLSSIIVWPFYHGLLGYFHIQRKALG